MKVQMDGLLLDLRTTKPPGPFSPLRPAVKEKTDKVIQVKLTQMPFVKSIQCSNLLDQ